VGWHTLWRAAKVEAAARIARPSRLDGVETLGVDEHVWRPGRFGGGRDVTVMVDLTRGAACCVLRVASTVAGHGSGRSGTVYKSWLDAQSPTFRAGVKHAALDPFRGTPTPYVTASETPSLSWMPSMSFKLGTQVMDEVRRRVQQDTLHRRGHSDDPPYKIRGLLRHGAEHLSERQVARLGRTLRAWRAEALAYFDTGGVSNGGTEGINGIIEKTRRLGHGYRNFTNYRLRMLLAANGQRTYRRARSATP